MDQVTTDKKLYTDYKDDKMTQVTNLNSKLLQVIWVPG